MFRHYLYSILRKTTLIKYVSDLKQKEQYIADAADTLASAR